MDTSAHLKWVEPTHSPGICSDDGDNGSRTFSFMIDGHRFTAMISNRRGSSDHNNRAARNETDDRGTIIGTIAAADTHYDVFNDPQAVEADGVSAVYCLTSRELQIATLIAEGQCDKEIARHLSISSYTVREHLRRIFAKLKVCRRSAVVSCLLRGSSRGPF